MAQSKKTSSKKSSSAKTAQKQKKPKRREVAAVVCLLLAVFATIGYFSGQAVFIGFFRRFITGLVGWGFYIMAPVLVFASIVLGFHKGRPVRLRVSCMLLMPLAVGALLHLFLCKIDYSWSFKMLGKLYTDGRILKSGGLFGGLLAKGFADMFSKVGAAAVFICGFMLLALGSVNMTVVDAVKKLREHEKIPYEPEEDVVVATKQSTNRKSNKIEKASQNGKSNEITPEKTRRLNSAIDIPVDDPPKLKKKGGLFKSGGVMSPDQLFKKDVDLTKDVPQASQSRVHAPLPLREEIPAGNTVKTIPQVPYEPVHEEFTGIVPEKNAKPQVFKKEENTAEVPEEETYTVVRKPVVECSEPEQSIPQHAGSVKNPVQAPASKDVTVKKLKAEDIAAEEAEIARSVDEKLSQEQSYAFPPTSLLHSVNSIGSMDGREEMSMNAARLENTIRSFGVNATISNITRGPSVTRYEMALEQGVKLTRLTNLSDDIALALGASGVRIAPIPDQISMVGIEVPNKQVSTVYLREIIESESFRKSKSKVTFALGKDIGGNCICGNIEKLPHMLIAGTTGSGKSVCMNSLIISLLYKATPDEVRLIMIDPKMIELGVYNGIPHLLIPVVTDPKKAAGSLQWAVNEMMKRYRLFAELGARDIHSYNEMIKDDPERSKLPQVVIVIDELADLMLVAAKEVEESICRIAQMARAAGMHLVIATQRPSADVITGIMKANIPSRIAFAVASSLESRIILDSVGAEKLVGHGDMLYFPLGAGKPLRVQGTLIEGDEVERVVSFIKQSSGGVSYNDEIINEIEKNAAQGDKKSSSAAAGEKKDARDDGTDELFGAAVEVILESGQASVSMLQRRLKLGYSRAARLVDQMEERGIVGPFEGSKPRQTLITREQWNEMQLLNGTAPIVRDPVLTEENEQES